MKTDDINEQRPLLFEWTVRERRLRALIFGVVLAALGMLASFVVFRVVSSGGKRADSTTQSVVILDPSSLAAQRLIDYANDQSYLLLQPSTNDELAPLSMVSATPVFSPGFKDFHLSLRDLGQSQSPELRPRLFAADRALLPPVTVVKNSASTAATATGVATAAGAKNQRVKARLVASVSSELSERWLANAGEVAAALLPMDSRVTFRVAVDAWGRVTTALPLDQPLLDAAAAPPTTTTATVKAKADPDTLHRYVRGLRFKPQPDGKPLQWATLTLAWEVPTVR